MGEEEGRDALVPGGAQRRWWSGHAEHEEFGIG